MLRRAAATGAGLAVLLALLLGLLWSSPVLTSGQPEAGGCGVVPEVSLGTGAIGWPMPEGSYRLTSGYGPRWGALHAGVDLAAPLGTPIFAAHDGVVAESKGPGGPGLPGLVGGFDSWVVLDGALPDGSRFSTVYGHVDTYTVAPGQQVSAGQQIATVGNRGQSTGPHLHFEVWPGTRLGGGTSVDPAGWLAAHERPGEAPAEPVTPVADPRTGTVDLRGPIPPQGTQATMPIGEEQRANAATIAAVVKGRGLPLRAAVVAIATAMQESRLLNIDHGDRDSLGLFQQRPSQGWGSPEQILDPVYATGKFLDGLVGFDWQSMALTDAAQLVQRSGFPLAYAKWETQAMALAAEASGVAPIAAPGAACAA